MSHSNGMTAVLPRPTGMGWTKRARAGESLAAKVAVSSKRKPDDRRCTHGKNPAPTILELRVLDAKAKARLEKYTGRATRT